MSKEVPVNICPETSAWRDMDEFYILLDTRMCILRDQILEQAVLLGRLTGAVCHRFLVNDLPVLLEHVPLQTRQHMWFMHDGAPPHCLRFVRQHLNQTFGDQWIGLCGPACTIPCP
jgi:hypothetical protein